MIACVRDGVRACARACVCVCLCVKVCVCLCLSLPLIQHDRRTARDGWREGDREEGGRRKGRDGREGGRGGVVCHAWEDRHLQRHVKR